MSVDDHARAELRRLRTETKAAVAVLHARIDEFAQALQPKTSAEGSGGASIPPPDSPGTLLADQGVEESAALCAGDNYCSGPCEQAAWKERKDIVDFLKVRAAVASPNESAAALYDAARAIERSEHYK